MKEKNNKNYYKYTTYILLGLILLTGVIFGYNIHSQTTYTKGVEFGQQNAVSIILNEISQDGFIDINTTNGTQRIVNAQLVQYAQEEVILQIIDEISQNGAVNIYSQEQNLTLVEYVPENNFQQN